MSSKVFEHERFWRVIPRPNKVWFRKDIGWWMVTIGGKKIRLAAGRDNQKLAEQKFHELDSHAGFARFTLSQISAYDCAEWQCSRKPLPLPTTSYGAHDE